METDEGPHPSSPPVPPSPPAASRAAAKRNRRRRPAPVSTPSSSSSEPDVEDLSGSESSLPQQPRHLRRSKRLQAGHEEEEEEEEVPSWKRLLGEIGPKEYLNTIQDPSRALFLTVKELVENSLDATDFPSSKPTIKVTIEELGQKKFKELGMTWPKQKRGDVQEGKRKCYHIVCNDNGCGMQLDVAADLLETPYRSSKGMRQQSRGTYGICAKLVFIYAYETTSHNIIIETAQQGERTITRWTIRAESKSSHRLRAYPQQIENANGWSGTKVDLCTWGNWNSEKDVIQRYFELIPLVNQYIQIEFEFKPLRGKSHVFINKCTDQWEPVEHNNRKLGRFDPATIDLPTLKQGMKDSEEKPFEAFLINDFMKIEDHVAAKIIKKMRYDKQCTLAEVMLGDGPSNLLKALQRYEYESLVNTDGLFRVGEHFLSRIKGYIKEHDGTTFSKLSMSTSTFNGLAFIVEAVVALDTTQKKGLKVFRFANKAPLVLQEDSDIVSGVARNDIKWRSYEIDLSKYSVCVFVSLVSHRIPFNNIQKEYMCHSNAVKTAIQNALTDCCEDLKGKPDNDKFLEKSFNDKCVDQVASILETAALRIGRLDATQDTLKAKLNEYLDHEEKQGKPRAAKKKGSKKNVGTEDHASDALELRSGSQEAQDDSADNSPPQTNEASQVDLEERRIASLAARRLVTPQAGPAASELESLKNVGESSTVRDKVFQNKNFTWIQFWNSWDLNGEEYQLSKLEGIDLERSFSNNSLVERLPIDYFSKMLCYDDGKNKTNLDCPPKRVFLHTSLTEMLATRCKNRSSNVQSFLRESIEGIRQAKLIFLPFFYNGVWSLCCLDMDTERIIIFDSKMESSIPKHVLDALCVLSIKLEDYWDEVPDFFSWTPIFYKTIKVQQASDWGILMMKYMEYYKGKAITEEIDPGKVEEYKEDYLKRMIFHDCNILYHFSYDGYYNHEGANIQSTYYKMKFRNRIFKKKDVRFINVEDIFVSSDHKVDVETVMYRHVGLTGMDLEDSLKDTGLVEYEVVDIVLKMLSHEQQPGPEGPKVFLHTSVSKHLLEESYNPKHVKKLLEISIEQIRNAKLIFIPFLYGGHWTVTCLNFNSQEISLLDSLNKELDEYPYLEPALTRLFNILKSIWDEVPEFTKWGGSKFGTNTTSTRCELCNPHVQKLRVLEW